SFAEGRGRPVAGNLAELPGRCGSDRSRPRPRSPRCLRGTRRGRPLVRGALPGNRVDTASPGREAAARGPRSGAVSRPIGNAWTRFEYAARDGPTHPAPDQRLGGLGTGLPSLISRVDVVGIPSSDIERSRQFYVETLGLRPDENARYEFWV